MLQVLFLRVLYFFVCGVDYHGVFQLCETEDTLLPTAEEELGGNRRCLSEEGHKVTEVGVHKFLKRFEKSRTIACNPGSGKASKMTNSTKQIIEEQMWRDDKTTGSELQKLLSKEGINVSACTIIRWRQQLGWIAQGTKYCQMIRDTNKEKRLDWVIENKDLFLEDIIFSDESTIQIETHRWTCCYKRGQKPRYKPKPKHPIKVHVWAGISHRGRTNLCIFEGKMDGPLFISIWKNLLCRSSKMSILIHIVSFRTTTPSTVPRSQEGTTKRGGSTGGPLLQSRQTLIQSRTFGMSSKSTSCEKLSPGQSRISFLESKHFGQQSQWRSVKDILTT